MIVVVTYIKLKGILSFFRFAPLTSKVARQAESAPGLLMFLKAAGGIREFYTITAWENAEAMKQFARSGAHLEAMKRSREITDEVRTCTYEAQMMPTWPEAKRVVAEQGKVLKF
mmetsp:Transcript_25194/g.43505  ORF Transcript_25194/g.43505 Transcript_25194/m.43505 type:complete len:114 (+) Transcript_25194:338-679(+)|eukprot:CAMPEP_0196651622 /NCGR_PEP_ID=MMETSP1086-20130531/664_1 /TAXON_ID=77921 /ORGANISM="Cyanoptyche  gloeocystis , Strain SAG4.97" /LENGTH=113 /DNA_ID=CAMNT_0041981723 /DNA_START=338 /DNA_END=679 /DNA_ORIENTATION=+